jgi:hypothetical protein
MFFIRFRAVYFQDSILKLQISSQPSASASQPLDLLNFLTPLSQLAEQTLSSFGLMDRSTHRLESRLVKLQSKFQLVCANDLNSLLILKLFNLIFFVRPCFLVHRSAKVSPQNMNITLAYCISIAFITQP